MKIAVIGAGAAGLASIKHAINRGFDCNAFEQTDKVGGTWNYTDFVGVDENGLPVHSSMYKGLRANLPKELMEYAGYPYPTQKKSYVYQEEVIDYINSYASHYGLNKYIKFNRCVKKVHPVNNTKWEVTVLDTKAKKEICYVYDAVMVCNGHYIDPYIPTITGDDTFVGRKQHSHGYRVSESFAGKRVLLIGAGPSGTDISSQIASVASKVCISHGLEANVDLHPKVVQKPYVVELFEDGAIFKDLTKEEFDEILYCTGYKYTFPFLTQECGIKATMGKVQPLYKHCININHPTMSFIGIPTKLCPFPLFDLQVNLFLSVLSGQCVVPSREDMKAELKTEKAIRRMKGIPERHAHKIGKEQGNYFNELADAARIAHVPPVINKLFLHVMDKKNFNDCFKIIDDENFINIA